MTRDSGAGLPARALVQEIVEAVLARLLGAAQLAPPKPILFVLTGARRGHLEALALLRAVAPQAPCAVLLADCYRSLHGNAAAEDPAVAPLLRTAADAAAWREHALAAQAIVFPMPTMAWTTRVALGLDEAPEAMVAVEQLLGGLPLFAAGGDIDAETWPGTVPPLMRRGEGSLGGHTMAMRQRLEQWGMKYRRHPAELYGMLVKVSAATDPRGAAPAKLAPAGTIALFREQFVTVEDIRREHERGARHVLLGPGARLTEAAREAIGELSMTLEERG